MVGKLLALVVALTGLALVRSELPALKRYQKIAAM